MDAKELIALNNEKQKDLTDENEQYYGDMLVYIRLSSGKSEQQTEEVLLELLEHLLQAQVEGRTAEDVFGADPKAYCREIIGEIPQESRKRQVRFSTYIILRFLGFITFLNGIIGSVMYYFFKSGSGSTTFSVGSVITIAVIDIFILYMFIAIIFTWLKSTTFKNNTKGKKRLEFLQIWGIFVSQIGLFVAVIYFMPDFGAVVSIPTISLIIIGILLYLLSYLFKKNGIN